LSRQPFSNVDIQNKGQLDGEQQLAHSGGYSTCMGVVNFQLVTEKQATDSRDTNLMHLNDPVIATSTTRVSDLYYVGY